MKTALLLTATLLCSCELPLPSGAVARSSVGYFKPATPLDPEAKLGLFTERVSKEPEPNLIPLLGAAK